MLKAVLFDMDGLIFDTESVYKKSWQFAARDQGLELSDDFYQKFLGVKDAECEAMLAMHFSGKVDMPRYIQMRNDDFHQRRDQGIAMKSGFSELFDAIQERGLKTAIVTSSQLADVKHNFRHTDYLSRFDLIITAEDVKHGKPSPDCYLLACKQLELQPNECLVLEDSNNGVRAGLNAKCHTIMIPDLLPADNDIAHIVQTSSLKEVIPYLNQL